MEQWKPIQGYEGFYEISDEGRVKRLVTKTSTKAGRILVGGSSGEYRAVTLTKNGISNTLVIHRIVALHFLEKTSKERNQVNHKDGNKMNNLAKNLEWVTSKENLEHASINNLLPYGSHHPNAKLTEEQVAEIRYRYSTEVIGYRTLAKSYTVSHTVIKLIIKNKSWKRA